MNEDIKIYKHKDDGIWFATKDGGLYKFEPTLEYRLRPTCLSAHINWDSFLTEFKEVDVDELPDNLQNILEEECVRGTI